MNRFGQHGKDFVNDWMLIRRVRHPIALGRAFCCSQEPQDIENGPRFELWYYAPSYDVVQKSHYEARSTQEPPKTSLTHRGETVIDKHISISIPRVCALRLSGPIFAFFRSDECERSTFDWTLLGGDIGGPRDT